MRELPILMQPEMVRATLAGTKTQTRRVVNSLLGFGPITEFGRSDTPGYDWIFRNRRMLWNDLRAADLMACCPYGKPGDRLWVREGFSTCYNGPEKYQVIYPADGQRADFSAAMNSTDKQLDWLESSMNVHGEAGRPSIHMPRWASRILVDVKDVRLQRVQDISEEDAKAEGVGFDGTYWLGGIHPIKKTAQCWPTAKDAFKALWGSINAKLGQGWQANPWVWAISFRRIKP